MKKITTLSLILASTLFLSACTTSQNKTINPDQLNSSQSQSQENFSLRDLISKNIPQKCTYSSQDQDENFDIEIIIHGQKFKQTINSKTEDGDISFYTISDGEYFYSWGGGPNPNSGLKIKADFATKADNNSDLDKLKTNQADLDVSYQGKCSPVIITDSDFDLPKDIVFEDYTQLMEQIQQNFINNNQ